MAETESNSQITDDLTGDGASRYVRGKLVDVSVTGSFDATWTIQRMVNKDGVWGDIVSYTNPQERVIENASTCSVRISVSNHVSGTLKIKLAGDR